MRPTVRCSEIFEKGPVPVQQLDWQSDLGPAMVDLFVVPAEPYARSHTHARARTHACTHSASLHTDILCATLAFARSSRPPAALCRSALLYRAAPLSSATWTVVAALPFLARFDAVDPFGPP
jgi:hypothetical protein